MIVKYVSIMKQRIQIRVEIPDHVKAGNFKTLFRVDTYIDDCVCFDYSSVLKGLRCLYPDNAIITFVVS